MLERLMPERKKPSRKSLRNPPPPIHYIEIMLEKVTEKQRLKYAKGRQIFSQGDRADAIYFIETGKVRISVISGSGKEAVLAILGPRDCFGEGCLIRQHIRVSAASVLEDAVLFRVEQAPMLNALKKHAGLSQQFLAQVLARNIDLEADLSDQLFNHSEKRLARALLKLARLRKSGSEPDTNIGKLNHELLAEMVGTTRPRISYFMNKFRKLGFIDYNGGITIRIELLTDLVLHD
jgi:CRP/FNR family transcriptional regulator, cyclic AMP receptor protein